MKSWVHLFFFRTIFLGPPCHFYSWFPSSIFFSDSSRFIEYWVPVEISNVQRELYCEKLLLNPSLLHLSSSKDLVGALPDLLRSTRKVSCFCFISYGCISFHSTFPLLLYLL